MFRGTPLYPYVINVFILNNLKTICIFTEICFNGKYNMEKLFCKHGDANKLPRFVINVQIMKKF